MIFEPNPGPQTDFLAASELEVMFGGSGGSGKSFATLADPVRYFNFPEFRGLTIRRTNDELRELISKSRELYPRAIPGAKFLEREKTWMFPSGASHWFSFLDRDEDVERYRGQAFQWIGFDELTQWPTPYAWNFLRSRLRSTSGIPLSMRACVDEGEVLTEGGWVDIKDVEVGSRVYSVDSVGTLVLREVTDTHKYEVSEELVRVRKKNLYMSMTEDHKVLFSNYGTNKVGLVALKDCESKSIDVVRTSKSYKEVGYPSPIANFSDIQYAEFMGLYLAEGCFCKPHNGNYKVVITQNKVENHEWVRSVMEASGFRVCYSRNGDFQITNKMLHSYLSVFGKAFQKHFPRDFLRLASREQLKVAFDAYARGDGHWQSEKSCSITTTSKQMVDDLQEIAVKLGYKVQVATNVSLNPNHRNKYVVYVSLRGFTTKVDKNPQNRNDVTRETYTGSVYCLSVKDTQNFVLRQKGFVWVSGNSTNPGGPGHQWVKKMFIDAAPPNTRFPAVDIETGKPLVFPETITLNGVTRPHPKAGQPLFYRRFIPATLYDNPYLANDGVYEANLMSLPEHLRKQLLEGNWDVQEGAAFPEFSRAVHVCQPFEIPREWPRLCACDYGYSSFSGVVWAAVAPSGQVYIYRELYVSKVLAQDLAKMIEDIETEAGERIRARALDSSLWHMRGGQGINGHAEPMVNKLTTAKVRWRPSDRSRGSRVASKNTLHEYLKIDEYIGDGEPKLIIFNTCTQTIAQLAGIPLSKKNPEDVDTNAEDHLYDSIRYLLQLKPQRFTGTIYDFEDDFLPETTSPYKPVDEWFGV